MKDRSAVARKAAGITAVGLLLVPAGWAHKAAQEQEQAQTQAQAREPAPPDALQGGDAQAPAAVDGPLPARLSDVEGSVRLLRIPAGAKTPGVGSGTIAGETAFHHATVNMPVLVGMEVETGSDGRAELQFNNGSVARLTPNSALDVVTLENSGEQLRAVRGLSYVETPDREAGSTVVLVGAQGARPSAGSLVRFNLDSNPYQVAVLRGVAHFESGGAVFAADAGQTGTVEPGSGSGGDVRVDVRGELTKESWDEWNADRDAAMTQLAAGETHARAGTGDEDSPAWNDLDYYGTWYDVPGTGMAWAPDGVDASFDPYGSGAWGYYTGVGYTWISAYPWGWLPYHCGSWRYFEGFGWLWQPGAGYRNAGWYSYTHLEHRPPGYSFPLRPSVPRPHTRLTGAPMPKAQPLLPVSRGPGFGFRQMGGARPEPRVFPLGGVDVAGNSGAKAAPTLPLSTRSPQYRQPYHGPTIAGGTVQWAQPPVRHGGPVIAPGSGVIGPAPGIVAAAPGIVRAAPGIVPPPRTAVLPAPTHLVAPPSVRNSPPPPPQIHTAPPAVVAAPRAH